MKYMDLIDMFVSAVYIIYVRITSNEEKITMIIHYIKYEYVYLLILS